MQFFEILGLSAVMGLSIYVSYPLVRRKNMDRRLARFLTGIAVGILIFLIADVFSDASALMYNGSLYGYGSSPVYDFAFAISLFAGFFIMYAIEFRSKHGLSKVRISLLIAIGIGLQNLTEGLVFGATAVGIGLAGIALVILVGFIVQNITEGFPIGSPFFGESGNNNATILIFFLIGGIPTIIGGAVGFYYSSSLFNLVFDGLAIGAILYIIFPMLKGLFAGSDNSGFRVIYGSIFIGFLLGLAVNLI
ncbi:MAG: hypothetical protein AAE977_05235 [Thermoplasmataceae archaeon]|jgi:ZIP family zinc transporter